MLGKIRGLFSRRRNEDTKSNDTVPGAPNEVPSGTSPKAPRQNQMIKKNRTIKTLRQRLAKRDEEIEALQAQLANPASQPEDLAPEDVVWILGSPRTGSTWLSRMIGQLDGCRVWQEPFFGVMLSFRDNIANTGHAENANFLFGEPNKPIWLEHMKRLFLAVGAARFGRPDRLVVKEPNGSAGSRLILEAFPESSVVLLVRDPRDIVASLMDAAKPESWYGYGRYEASAVAAQFDPEMGKFVFPQASTEEDYVEHLAQDVAASITAAWSAFEGHNGPKVLVKYEELRADTLGTMQKLCSALEIEVDLDQLAMSVEKASWENIPAENKGSGKHHRKATPGSWKADLTPEQAKLVERATAPILEKFYPE